MGFYHSRRKRVQVDLNDRDKDGKVISIVKQSDLERCDIRNIVKRYRKTGVVSGVVVRSPMYGDVSNAPDFLLAMNIVARANEQFASLPAELRDRFNNDPAKFMEFCHNPDNSDEMIKLGLKEKPKAPEPPAPPLKVEVVNPLPDKS